ncbi:ABC transporter ATP-binding protein [Cryobacterium tagatosivorans]|uniref:ABC transporter ATP-binding protein n=1 Tax=Cryobacterium tagatosivorans TaxID=1259199 RepID=A0A4R8UGF7_9MICO|nr:ABC transporter ATP-binding protein [Cryobacterium tagatosivorans]TFB52447.1 ABC transporter ATP-binding protein [Cryobacterium tagatosivorans]
MLEIRNLSVAYGKIVAVSDLSLTVNEGEIVTVVGGNGAGKTTTLRTVSGVLKPRAGEILFKGQSIVGLPPEAIVTRGISHSPEGRMIFGRLTITENLKLGAYNRKDAAGVKSDMERMFGMFPVLEQRKSQRAGTLSGGEQQMLAIARSLMSRPTLLLLDEPSLGLAPLLVEKIFDVVVELRNEGVTILLVEQNANEALRISDRAYVLETGTVTVEGPSTELINDPKLRAAYLGLD